MERQEKLRDDELTKTAADATTLQALHAIACKGQPLTTLFDV